MIIITRNIKCYLLIIIYFIFISCTNNEAAMAKAKADSLAAAAKMEGELFNQRSFEITSNGDTVNLRDNKGLKQGMWIINTGVLLTNGGIKKDTVYYKDGNIQKK